MHPHLDSLHLAAHLPNHPPHRNVTLDSVSEARYVLYVAKVAGLGIEPLNLLLIAACRPCYDLPGLSPSFN